MVTYKTIRSRPWMFPIHRRPLSHCFLCFSHTDCLSNLQVCPDFFYFSTFTLGIFPTRNALPASLCMADLCLSFGSQFLNVTSSERPLLIFISKYISFRYPLLFLDCFFYDIFTFCLLICSLVYIHLPYCTTL